MTYAQVNEEITESQSSKEVKILQQEILRLQMLLQNHGIQYSDTLTTKAETTTATHNHNTPSNTNFASRDNKYNIENGNDDYPLHTYAQDEVNMKQTVKIDSNHKLNNETEEVDSYVKEKTNEVKDASSTNLQRMTCEKIVSALGIVLVAVDSFLKTINIKPLPSRARESSELQRSPSNQVDRDPPKERSRVNWEFNDKSTTNKINRATFQTPPTATEKKRVTSVFKPPEAINYSNHAKNKALSTLLQQRRKLKGMEVENEIEDLELKEELKKAREQKEKKIQLRQWLLEKETKAEKPLPSCIED